MHIRHHAGNPVLPSAEESRAASQEGERAAEAARRKGLKVLQRHLENLFFTQVICGVLVARALGHRQVTITLSTEDNASIVRVARRVRAANYRASVSLHKDNALIVSWWDGV